MSRTQASYRPLKAAHLVRRALPQLASELAAQAIARSHWRLPLEPEQLLCLHRAAALLLYRLALLAQVEARALGGCGTPRQATREGADLSGRVDRALRNLAAAPSGRVYVGPMLAGRLQQAARHAHQEWVEAVRFLRRHRTSDAALSGVFNLLRRDTGQGKSARLALGDPQWLGWLHEAAMAVCLHQTARHRGTRRSGLARSPVKLTVRRWRTRRRATGSFYTPDAVVRQIVSKAVRPALRAHLEGVAAGIVGSTNPTGTAARRLVDKALDFAVLDPAMGCGQFLAAAVEVIAETVHEWLLELGLGDGARRRETQSSRARLRNMVLARCVFGVDSDPVAVELARTCLSLQAASAGHTAARLGTRLEWGDSLVGRGPKDTEAEVSRPVSGVSGAPPLDWPAAFERVLRRRERPGFDAVIGNPPWISFSGRQRQTLPAALADYWLGRYQGFSGWRSTHGLFLERAVTLVKNDGYVGLVLPLQIADLPGYGGLRRAIRQRARLVGSVSAIGEDRFAGVTGPAGIYVLRRNKGGPSQSRQGERSWPVRGDPRGVHLAPALPRNLVQKVQRFAALPPKTFGDPGVHTGNSARLLISDRPAAGEWVPIRQGRDVLRYRLQPPKTWLRLDLQSSDGRYWRIAAPATYSRARLLLRQTANRPIAAPHHEPAHFRNSALAYYGLAGWDDDYVLALLNSKLIACLHRRAFADAAQRSFPQVKVSHLQGLRLPTYVAQHLSNAQNLLLGRMIGCLQSAATREDADDLAARCRLAEAPTVVLQHLLAHAARMMIDMAEACDAVQKAGDVNRAGESEASVTRLDGLIDRIVYRLYDLGPEEIAAVERMAAEAVGT